MCWRTRRSTPRLAPEGDLSAFSDVDIIHCPFQTPDVDLAMWRTRGRRTLVTLHDLIAFQTPAYFNVPEHWFEYRQGHPRASEPRWTAYWRAPRRPGHRSGWNGSPLRKIASSSFPLGTGHLRGNEDTRLPDELLARGFAEKQFIVVLGTNYTPQEP